MRSSQKFKRVQILINELGDHKYSPNIWLLWLWLSVILKDGCNNFDSAKPWDSSDTYPYASPGFVNEDKKKYNAKGCQRVLLIALSVIELSYAVGNIRQELSYYKNMEVIAESLSIFNLIYIFLVYVFIMFLITMHRFLEIYLNIKYRILWSPKKQCLFYLLELQYYFFHWYLPI